MMNYRFAHTTPGEATYSSGYEALQSGRSSAPGARSSGWIGRIAAAFRAISRWNRYRKTVRELHRLDDRTLRDIGLQRDEIAYVARGLSGRSDGWPSY